MTCNEFVETYKSAERKIRNCGAEPVAVVMGSDLYDELEQEFRKNIVAPNAKAPTTVCGVPIYIHECLASVSFIVHTDPSWDQYGAIPAAKYHSRTPKMDESEGDDNG